MTEIPEDARKNINEAFAERLERTDPPMANVIIEAKPGQTNELLSQLSRFSGVTVNRGKIAGGVFIPATVPEKSIPDIARLDAVELIHQDQLMSISEVWSRARDVPFLFPETDPVRKALSDKIFEAFTPEDQYLGGIGIDEIEVSRFNFAQVPPGDLPQISFAALDEITGMNTDGKNHIPTIDTVSWLLDGDALPASSSGLSKVAVLDTGHTPTPAMNGTRIPYLSSQVPGEVPTDFLGHGSWTTNTVAGARAPSTHGTVAGVSPGATYGHIKCLNSFPGVGKTSWILAAMDEALSWGADVISMSLGGDQQGPVDQDPYSRFINRNCKENAGDDDGAIFVVAAGNAGPEDWTIGSPGVAPKALTVGSWSMMDASPALFSSRGPQGTWYGAHQKKFQADLKNSMTGEFVKPDVVAPGGGRENSKKSSDNSELLHQVSTGWMEGLYDGLKDGRASMRGTSMATPHVAGLVYRLYDAGMIDTAADVKSTVKSRSSVSEYKQAAPNANESVSGKNIAVGFGPIHESLWG